MTNVQLKTSTYKSKEQRAQARDVVLKVLIYAMLVFWALMVLFPFYYTEDFQQRGGVVKALTPKTRPSCDRQVGEL